MSSPDRSRRPLRRSTIVKVAAYLALVVVSAVVVSTLVGGDDDAPTKRAAKAPVAAPDPDATTAPPVIETVKEQGSVLDVLKGVKGAKRFTRVVRSLPKDVFVQERGVTLLVPPDRSLTDAQVAKLVKDENAASAFVSRYLVVGGRALADLGPKVSTADGTKRTVDAKRKTIGGVKVATADIKATNGRLQLLSDTFD